MSEGYRFREVRKGERDDVLTFAAGHGLAAEAQRLQHHLSLVVNDAEDQLVAAALCLEDGDGRLVIHVVSAQDALEPGLASELADRCLRKVQSQSVASARIVSPTSEPAESILGSANWLDSIEETPPAEVLSRADDTGTPQAA